MRKKTIKIKDIYSLFNKYGQLGLRVETPSGFKKIETCDITFPNSNVFETKTENGLSIKTSPDHLLKTKNGRFKKVILLSPGDIIKTINGNEKIISIEFLPYKKDLYDIQVEGVHQYYSNGIVSHNSSILNALSFCLFDKGANTGKAIQVMNSRKNNFSCKLNFEIDGIDYFIQRNAVRKGDAAPCPADFFKILPSGEEEPLNGGARRDTAAIVRSYVGDYEDFALTALSVQNGTETNFIQKSQSQRKDLLMRFLDLSVFDQLYDIGSKEIKDYSALLKKYEIRKFDEEIVDIDSSIDRYENDHSLIVIVKNGLSKTREVHNSKIISLTKQLLPADNIISDILSLETKKDGMNEKMKASDETLISLRTSMQVNLQRGLELKTKLEKYKVDGVSAKYDDYTEQTALAKKLEAQLGSLKSDMSHHIEKIERLKKLEYNPECDSCKKNIEIADADTVKSRQLLEECIREATAIKKQHLEIAGKLVEYVGVEDEYDAFLESEESFKGLHMKLLKLGSEMAAEENKILSLKNDLVVIDNDIQKYYKNKEAIENNKKIEKEIKEVKADLLVVLGEITDVEAKELDVTSKLLFFKDKRSETENEIDHFKDVEERVRAYDYYLQAINKDGIPYELISKSIPMIEAEVNNILSQVTDFVVMLELDKKSINARIVYDENRSWPAELGSGMEQFIAGLAIRVALINVSHLPRPNFISIDEGFTALDADNLSNLPTVFDYLRNQFDFCLIISHLEQIRDFVDMIMDLKKEEEYSKIVFT